MAGAWHGGVQGVEGVAQWANHAELRAAISLAMGYWISRDVGENVACLGKGGSPDCPCDDPSNALW